RGIQRRLDRVPNPVVRDIDSDGQSVSESVREGQVQNVELFLEPHRAVADARPARNEGIQRAEEREDGTVDASVIERAPKIFGVPVRTPALIGREEEEILRRDAGPAFRENQRIIATRYTRKGEPQKEKSDAAKRRVA